jgi:hypothetical protein
VLPSFQGWRPARHRDRCLSGQVMTNRTKYGAEESINSERLAALLDKLVAVDLDLEPICRIRVERVRVSIASAHDVIAGAYDTLRLAIGDLRDIIHRVDGLKYLLPAIAVHQDPKSAVAQAFCMV